MALNIWFGAVELVKARLVVRGNVQGVGFRVWACLFARKLRVKGLVRNLPDGSIESFVEGSKETIEEFIKRISVKGLPGDPLSLHVEEIKIFWEGKTGYEPPWKEYKGFEVDYGAEELRGVDREMLESLEWSKLHFVGMSRVFREEMGGLKEEFKAARSDIQNTHRDAGAVHSEIKSMHEDVRVSFQEMAKRYDAISSELIRTREELTRAVNKLAELVEKFVEKA